MVTFELDIFLVLPLPTLNLPTRMCWACTISIPFTIFSSDVPATYSGVNR
jgi:hypothetical protein